MRPHTSERVSERIRAVPEQVCRRFGGGCYERVSLSATPGWSCRQIARVFISTDPVRRAVARKRSWVRLEELVDEDGIDVRIDQADRCRPLERIGLDGVFSSSPAF